MKRIKPRVPLELEFLAEIDDCGRGHIYASEGTGPDSQSDFSARVSAPTLAEKYFHPSLWPVVMLKDSDVKKIAAILLQIRTAWYGPLQDEGGYFDELCDAIASSLRLTTVSDAERAFTNSLPEELGLTRD